MTASKLSIDDLAVLGGRPAFADPLVVNQPNVGDRAGFIARIEAMLDDRWFTNGGPLVPALEDELARFLGVRHCVVTCNGTLALGLLSRALGLSGEVIVPSFTFIATAHAFLAQGIDPVFCDIDSNTWNIDAERVEELITARTVAVVGVHLWGRPCAVESLEQIARRHDLRLLFDAAHAFGCGHRGRLIGGFGDAEVFSFHATKVFHTFEGGAVTTNDDELAERVRLLRNFGFTDYDDVVALGTNAKMPEACAAMGLSNLESLDASLGKAQRTHEAFRQGLADVPGLHLLRYDDSERHNRHYVVVEVEEEEAGISRDQIVRILHAENVIARRYFYPGCHRMEPYASRSPEIDGRLPNTNRAAQRVLVLPGGSEVTGAQALDVSVILGFVVGRAGEIRSRLESGSRLD